MTSRVVCIVDDDVQAANSVQALLHAAGFSSRIFTSAESFLDDFLAHKPSDIGCLILDVRLPGMTGIELQQEMQRHGTEIPVILISGHATEEVRELGLANGASQVFEKPYDGLLLVVAVRKHCAMDD